MKIARILGWVAFGYFVCIAILMIFEGTHRMDLRTIIVLTITLAMYRICMIPYYVVKGFKGGGTSAESAR